MRLFASKDRLIHAAGFDPDQGVRVNAITSIHTIVGLRFDDDARGDEGVQRDLRDGMGEQERRRRRLRRIENIRLFCCAIA